MTETKPASSPSLWKIFVALSALTLVCCMAILCYWAALFFVVDQDISLFPIATLNPACDNVNCLNACIRRLPEFAIPPLSKNGLELANRVQGYEIARYKLNEQTGQFVRVATPTVPEYLKPYQADTALHQQIGGYFTDIFPNETDVQLSYMVVYMNNAPQHFSALIRELDGRWQLHINLIDIDSSRNLIEILTHEYGHMLTLNKNQVKEIDYGWWNIEQSDFDRLRSTCNGRFFDGVSCALEKAYLNAFGNRFWLGEVYEPWMKAFLMADTDPAAYRTALDELYANHRDQFVSSYAATNPREDIAESWTEFVLRPKPTGAAIADQKVLFFYEFPDLVQLRSKIIHNTCQYAIAQK